ncbi:hypothetical protein N7486_002314 [Penicillium sp. IBT 16267x]|nr:hypothetical protein N7486_002314 [Penicillium sp. IBT 16267x]
MSNFKSTLLSKTWFGFDLDDTLHEFRKASTQASQNVFEAIHTVKELAVTEGPADAQQWTAKEVGLESYVDVLVTTNEVGWSKVDGLFGAVLEKGYCFFGDNAVQDIQAAGESGVLAVLYDEERDRALDNLDTMRIDSWGALRDILLGDDGK